VVAAEPTLEVGGRLPVGPTISFAETLRRFRELRGMTQAQLAQRVGVQRATFTQWESGRHMPIDERLRELDKLLGAEGELIAAAAEQGRPVQRPVLLDGVQPATEGGRSVLRVLRETRRAFLDQLQYADSDLIGWRHNLVQSDEPPSVLSTAYGLKVLALLGGPDARTPAVADYVLRRCVRSEDGRLVGWVSRTQTRPRMEATGPALDALLHTGVPISVDDVERMLRGLVDDTARERPFILATGLEPLLRVAPDSKLAAELVKALLDTRIERDDVLLWPEKKRLHRDQPLLAASVAHTARAVTVLRDAPSELVGDAVTSAEQWLADVDDVNGVSEVIRRRLDTDRVEELSIDHFTSAWVVRALAGGEAPYRRQIQRALEHVWARYHEPSHFWAWGNGDVPVWLLADAVAALRDTALALSSAPIIDSG
jgi:transcriptional regulator with XRE-family HTH domain